MRRLRSSRRRSAFEPAHPLEEPSPVDLELRLAGTPGPDAAGLLAECSSSTAQTGQPVAEEGQLDLGLALGGPRVLGEDVEDHRGAVDGGPTEDLLEVALLCRREIVVEDHGVGIDCQADLA